MVRYTTGNILDAETEAVVNTVNTVGVMGKGIALMFKQAYPENFRQYSDAVKRNEIEVGHVFPVKSENLLGPKWILNFPTKRHWRHPSKLAWIEAGLQWDTVRPMIERILGAIPDLDVLVYQPI